MHGNGNSWYCSLSLLCSQSSSLLVVIIPLTFLKALKIPYLPCSSISVWQNTFILIFTRGLLQERFAARRFQYGRTLLSEVNAAELLSSPKAVTAPRWAVRLVI